MFHSIKNFFPVSKQSFDKHCNEINSDFKNTNENLIYLQKQLEELRQIIEKTSLHVSELSTTIKHANFEGVINKLSQNLKEITDILEKRAEQNQSMSEALLSDSQVQLRELHEIRVANAAPTIWYDSDFERKFFKDSFGKDFDKNINLEKDFLALIHGLDLESIRTVIRVLNRQKKLYERDKKFLNIFTLKEQQILRDINQNFYGNILKISDSLYCYDGYVLPQNHFEVIVFYYQYYLNSFQTIENIKTKNIIDAGGFIGDSALLFSKYTSQNVYSFEAIPTLYEDMKKTISLNHLTNVIAENKALSSKSDVLTFQVRGNCSTADMHSHKELDYSETVQVDSISLDEYVKANNLKVGLIKVDIEGSEQDFIEGALETIRTQKPALIFSIYHSADDFFHIKTILENLNLGYEFRIRQPQIGKAILETLLFAEVINKNGR